jgi:subtilisin family serine protease
MVALAHASRVRVIVAFRGAAARPVGGGLAQITHSTRSLREQILARLGPKSGFTPTARWNNVAALAGYVTHDGLDRLARDPDVLRIDLDTGGRTADAESLPLIGGDVAHIQGFTGKGVTVAIVDSGVDRAHPDLANAVVDEHCFVVLSGCPNGESEQSGPGSARDEHGHGTNVAGIIASDGNIAPIGVAPDASLVVVRVLDRLGRFASLSQVISALDWIASNHPEVRLVNMSLGTDQLFTGACDSASAGTLALASAVNSLRAQGTLLFVASGNQASATSMSAPACIGRAVAVGAVYDSSIGPASFPGVCADSTTAADRVTCFSNGDSALDLLAPGALITASGVGGGTSTFVGTSQAAPHATGAAALLLQQDPALTADQLEALLKSSGTNVTDTRNQTTIPRVDVAAALNLRQQSPPVQPPPPDRARPSVRAVRGTYRAGARTRLTFVLRDDSNEARVVERVFSASGRTLGTVRSKFLTNADGRAYTLAWRAPKKVRGRLKHCTQAWDRAGNASPRTCALLRPR